MVNEVDTVGTELSLLFDLLKNWSITQLISRISTVYLQGGVLVTLDFNQEWLIKKFGEIQSRLLKAINQLDDEQLNWKPNEASHSISTLIKHIEGNIQERILKGILHQEIQRKREDEFKQTFIKKTELVTVVEGRFQLIIDLIRGITDEKLSEKQIVRNKERTHLDMLHQCAAHYSEHMGQIFYITKLCLDENYNSTSIYGALH